MLQRCQIAFFLPVPKQEFCIATNLISLRFAPGLGQFWCLCESLHLGLSKEEEKRSKFLFSILMPFVNPSMWTYFDSQTWGFVSVLLYWITLTIPITFCEFWRTGHVSIQYWASFLMVACLLASNFFTKEKRLSSWDITKPIKLHIN